MSGGPIDFTAFSAVVGILYWVAAIVALVLALRLPKTTSTKATAALIVVAVFGMMPAARLWTGYQAQSVLDKSMALFRERCKTAGETITRTVESVEGVVWMKWREEYSNADNFADQFKPNDPYGRDCGLEDCLAALLRVTSGAALYPEEAKRHRVGYAYVETIDPRDGQRYRYRGLVKTMRQRTPEEIEAYKKNSGRDPGPDIYGYGLERQSVGKFESRYGVTWDDISTRQDREHWVAGSSLKVVDLHTNEIIAERIGYMIDRGQGSQAGFRSPWLFAQQTACPEFPTVAPADSRRSRSGAETREFALKVLHSSQGE